MLLHIELLMFFNPFGMLGGVASLVAAGLQVAWGATKIVAKAGVALAKGAYRVGRKAYKTGKPLAKKVVKLLKNCAGSTVAAIAPPSKAMPAQGEPQLASMLDKSRNTKQAVKSAEQIKEVNVFTEAKR